jgi:hypothetical protein
MPIFNDSSPYTVMLSDPAEPEQIEEWARTVEDFVGLTVTDVSDISNTTDTIYTYLFETKESEIWFRLRWE